MGLDWQKINRAGLEYEVSSIWALHDFTAEVGATRVVRERPELPHGLIDCIRSSRLTMGGGFSRCRGRTSGRNTASRRSRSATRR